jgi:hypothetical protein
LIDLIQILGNLLLQMLLDLPNKERNNKGASKEGTIDLFSLGVPDNNTRKEIDSSRNMGITTTDITMCPVVSVSEYVNYFK